MTEESNLVRHARYELEKIGEDPKTIEGYLKIIQAFADMNHSGGSASVAIPTLNQLLQFKPLSPLTNDPSEWQFISGKDYGVAEDVWQSRRDFKAFSNDGGKTYYLVGERNGDSWLVYQSADVSEKRRYILKRRDLGWIEEELGVKFKSYVERGLTSSKILVMEKPSETATDVYTAHVGDTVILYKNGDIRIVRKSRR